MCVMSDLEADYHVNRMLIVLEVLDHRWLCHAALKVVLIGSETCCRDFVHRVNAPSFSGSFGIDGRVQKVDNYQAYSQLETLTVIDHDFNIRFGISLANFIRVDRERLICKTELRIKGVCDELAELKRRERFYSGVGEDEPRWGRVLGGLAFVMTMESTILSDEQRHLG
jgi:hypothetical protein